MSDEIDRPAHYTKNNIECIDYIKQQLGSSFRYHLEACVIKYLHRYKIKGTPVTDLKKAQWYLEKLLAEQIQESKIGFKPERLMSGVKSNEDDYYKKLLDKIDRVELSAKKLIERPKKKC